MGVVSNAIAAEIITTGTEILLGEIVDTNAAWIAQQLRDAGINLYYKTTVGDNTERLRAVVEAGLARSNVLILSGGLGPTVDDVTRQAVALATGRKLRLDAEALSALEARFARFGVTMTDNNRQQAMVPDGATIIPNPVGTAPGFILETGVGTIIAVPGVPREMKRLMSDTVLPYLSDRSGHRGAIRRRLLRTVGIGESALDDMLSTLMKGRNPTIGLAAHTAQVDIRVTARADTGPEAERMVEETARVVRGLVGDYIYAEASGATVEGLIVDLLADRNETVAVLESNTCGNLAKRIQVQSRGAGVMVWAATSSSAELPPLVAELVDESVNEFEQDNAVACARAVRETTGATYGVAILGSSDPEGGIFGTAAGTTWIALVGGEAEASQRLQFGGTDEYTVTRISNQALSLLWQNLRIRP